MSQDLVENEIANPTAQAGSVPAPNPDMLVSDEALNGALQRAGIQTTDPKAREHLRGALREANEYAQLELNDPKYIEHSAHMGIDPSQTVAALALIDQKRAAMDQQIEAYKNDLIRRDQSQKRAGNWGAIGGAVVGIASSLAATSKKLNGFLHKGNAGWKRIAVTILGSTLVTAGLAWVGGKVFGGNPEKLMADAQSKGQEFEAQLGQLDQAEAQVLQAEEFKFTDIHLQRSFKTFQDRAAKQHEKKTHHAEADLPEASDQPEAAHFSPMDATKPTVAPEGEVLNAVSTDGEPLGAKAHSGRGSGESVTREPSTEANISKVADGAHNEPPYSITSPVAKDPVGGTLPPFGTTGLPRSETAHLGQESASPAGEENRNVPSYAEAAVQNEVKGQFTAKAVADKFQPIEGENRRWV